MATIKAGTYRFNSEIFVDPDRSVTEYFYFTRMTSTSEVVLQTGINVRTENGDVVVYYCRDDSVFVGVYRGAWAIEECRTITITEGSEVSPEFYTWFTANAVEVVEHTVSGVWRFKDELSLPTSRIFQQITFSLNTFLNLYGVSVNAVCDSILVDYAGAAHNVVSTIPDISSVYPLPAVLTVYSLPGNHEEFEGWNDYAYDEGIKTVDFGTEPQAVSAEFYEWFRKNARPAFATIWYNGGKIANLFGSQTATLKCAGMKMESDVVVEVAEQSGDANIVPLLVADAGTFDANSPVIVTETFTGGGTPDVVYNFWGTNIPYFKAKKLVATKDIFYLAYNEDLVEKLYADLFGDVIPICQLNLNRAFSDTSLVAMVSGVPAIIWVIATDETDFTKEAGFEDGGVYIVDAWNLMGAEGAASLTALGTPDKPVDGFMPVNVAIPFVDELVIPAGYSSNSYNDGPYRRVKQTGMTGFFLTVTPNTVQQEFQYNHFGDGTYIARVIVEPMDISDLSNKKVLCGIYLEPFPRTEYVYGEVLDVSGIYVVRMYTNGETVKVNLMSTDIDGWNQVTGPGTYTLTVKYSENGINTQTTFRINVK